MMQAVLEGVVFALRDSLEVAKSLGIKIERTKICGGGAKSPLWRKMIANIMNLKVDIIESEEGPALGGAILAKIRKEIPGVPSDLSGTQTGISAYSVIEYKIFMASVTLNLLLCSPR